MSEVDKLYTKTCKLPHRDFEAIHMLGKAEESEIRQLINLINQNEGAQLEVDEELNVISYGPEAKKWLELFLKKIKY